MRCKDRKPVRSRLLASIVVATGLWLVGCQDLLLAPTDERTQFDRYDRVRNNFAPQYVEDEFGRRTPNLRGRLAPKK